MLSIRSSADMARALAGPLDANLRRLLEQRRDQLLDHEGYDLGELVHIIVVGPGDTIDTIETEAGVSFASDLDGGKWGDPGFRGPFEFVERHGRWLEAVMILSDDGFGVAIFAADCITISADLLGLLRAHI